MTRRVYIYAFDHLYKIVCCVFLEGDAISVRSMNSLADQMMEMSNPSTISVYAVDNRPGLFRCYRDAISSNDFADRIAFADIVKREGIRLK